jgi:hypothetical protein
MRKSIPRFIEKKKSDFIFFKNKRVSIFEYIEGIYFSFFKTNCGENLYIFEKNKKGNNINKLKKQTISILQNNYSRAKESYRYHCIEPSNRYKSAKSNIILFAVTDKEKSFFPADSAFKNELRYLRFDPVDHIFINVVLKDNYFDILNSSLNRLSSISLEKVAGILILDHETNNLFVIKNDKYDILYIENKKIDYKIKLELWEEAYTRVAFNNKKVDIQTLVEMIKVLCDKRGYLNKKRLKYDIKYKKEFNRDFFNGIYFWFKNKTEV